MAVSLCLFDFDVKANLYLNMWILPNKIKSSCKSIQNPHQVNLYAEMIGLGALL